MTIQSSSKCIGGVVSYGLESVHAVLVLVDIHTDQGSKDLLLEDSVLGSGDLHDGWLHEVAHAVVIAAASNDAAVGTGFCMFNIAGQSLEGLLINHGGHKGVGLCSGAHLQGLLGLNQTLLDLAPQGLWNVNSGAGGALLTLVFKGRSHSGSNDALHFGCGVDKVVVLTATLSDELENIRKFVLNVNKYL